MKKWRCTVCGYIHEGEEPPEICPVCGANKSAFELVEEKTAQSSPEKEPEQKAASVSEEKINQENFQAQNSSDNNLNSVLEKIDDAIIKHHLHPISVHIPNGVIPIAVFLLIIGSLFNNQSLIDAAYYNIAMVFLAMPIVLYTGYVEWRNRYNKALTGIFKTKISAAAVVAFLSIFISLWKSFSPDAGGLFFLICHIIMLVAAGIAGHIGGKFVFKE